MPPKTTAKKGLKSVKGTRKAKAKNTVQQMSDSDDSDSLLGTDRPSQRPVERPEGSEHEKRKRGKWPARDKPHKPLKKRLILTKMTVLCQEERPCL